MDSVWKLVHSGAFGVPRFLVVSLPLAIFYSLAGENYDGEFVIADRDSD